MCSCVWFGIYLLGCVTTKMVSKTVTNMEIHESLCFGLRLVKKTMILLRRPRLLVCASVFSFYMSQFTHGVKTKHLRVKLIDLTPHTFVSPDWDITRLVFSPKGDRPTGIDGQGRIKPQWCRVAAIHTLSTLLCLHWTKSGSRELLV